jgi:hypothetical protein
MVQKKPRRRIAPTSGFLDRIVKDADILVTVAHQLVVLDDQADVMLTGTPKFMFQPFTVVTRVHIAASSTFDRVGIRRHRKLIASLLQLGTCGAYFAVA